MKKGKYLPFLLLLPTFVIIVLISIYPVVISIIYSLSDMRYLENKGFVGFANYIRMAMDSNFWRSLIVSIKYFALSIVLVIPFSLLIAQLLTLNIKFKGLFRTIIFLPWVLSQTVVALTWLWLLNGNFGPLTWILESIGFKTINFLSNSSTALPCVVVANVWNSYPLAVVFFMAAIESIPVSLDEAAKIDGASAFQRFTKVTLPMIAPTLTIVLIQLTVLYFNMVTLLFIMTNGGPLSTTRTLSLFTFQNAFQLWNTSYAAALTLVLTVINILFALFYVKFFGKQKI